MKFKNNLRIMQASSRLRFFVYLSIFRKQTILYSLKYTTPTLPPCSSVPGVKYSEICSWVVIIWFFFSYCDLKVFLQFSSIVNLSKHIICFYIIRGHTFPFHRLRISVHLPITCYSIFLLGVLFGIRLLVFFENQCNRISLHIYQIYSFGY